jgi:multicomponent Na+:H+ antiporter subunit B
VIIPLDIILLLILIATAVLSLIVRDLLAAVALLAVYSLFTALLFTGLQALDVALVEAALGAGLTGVLLIAAILLTTRRAEQRPHPRARVLIPVIVAGFVGLMLYASTGLPDRGDPAAPAQQGVSRAYLEGSLPQTRTPNVVTAILADYRSMDTLGETLVILTAALSATLILARRFDHPEVDSTPESGGAAAGPDPEGTDGEVTA